jgi:hypothetical protein
MFLLLSVIYLQAGRFSQTGDLRLDLCQSLGLLSEEAEEIIYLESGLRPE